MTATMNEGKLATFGKNVEERARALARSNPQQGSGENVQIQGAKIYEGSYCGVKVLEWKSQGVKLFLIPKEPTAKDDEFDKYSKAMKQAEFFFDNAHYSVWIGYGEEWSESKCVQLGICYFKRFVRESDRQEFLKGRLLEPDVDCYINFLTNKKYPDSKVVGFLNLRPRRLSKKEQERKLQLSQNTVPPEPKPLGAGETDMDEDIPAY